MAIFLECIEKRIKLIHKRLKVHLGRIGDINARTLRSSHALLPHKRLFTQFFAIAKPCVLDADVASRNKAAKAYETPCNVINKVWFAHVQHKDFTIAAE